MPCTWPWLLDLVHPAMPQPILEHEKTLHIVRSSCVLCGLKLGHTKSVMQHLQRDHAPMLNSALAAHEDLLQYMIMSSRCNCGCVTIPTEHKCPVHYQILLLRYLQEHPLQGLPLIGPEVAEQLQACWHDPELRAKLTQQCSQCQMPISVREMSSHLQSHPYLMDRALPLLLLAQSPFLDCCAACLDSSKTSALLP